VDYLIGILNALIVLGSLFLVCIILIQRGKGGGLAGAFGGVGGSSAFGTKAGDVFTRITIGVAIGWILTAMLLVVLTNRRAGSASTGWGNEQTSASKELSPSSKSKTKAPAAGAGDLPLTPPSPATDTGAGAPPIPSPVDIPAIPDQPARTTGTPSTAKTPSSTAPASTPSSTPGKASPPSR
jgi:preprotein translocase subunit SecG